MNGILKGVKVTYRLSIFDRVNILLGSSGEGKTLLRNAINEVTSGDGEFIIDSFGITRLYFMIVRVMQVISLMALKKYIILL